MEEHNVNVVKDGQNQKVKEHVPYAKGTSVNALIAAGVGFVLTVICYLILLLPGLSGTLLCKIFYERGIIQYGTAFFFFWGAGILLLKVKHIREEYKSFNLNVLDLEPGALIRQSDALNHIRKLKRLSDKDINRLLVNRIWNALLRFKLLGSAEKVDDILKYQGEMDDSSMESSYSFLKFIIALIPILGFLGTVVGISEAVDGFSGIINAADSTGGGGVESIQSALKAVTLGLATAFDTTVLALVMSAILMLGLTLFQRAEEVLLSKIESYCLENLLNRLWVPPVHEQFEEAMIRAVSKLPKNIADELKVIMK